MNVYLVKLYISSNSKFLWDLELIWTIAKNEQRAIELATEKCQNYYKSYPNFKEIKIEKNEVVFIEEMTMWN